MTELPVKRAYAAFLFDMDGTLIDSIASANRCWQHWAERHHLDFERIRPTMHGVRAVETIARWAPYLDVEQEFAALTQAEMDDVGDVASIGGADVFLRALPQDRWAIVTSAPRTLALRRLAAAGLPMPAILITADDVTCGKPAPDCFLMAATALGVLAGNCLVWEDAPAGIAAAQAAGMDVIVIGATHNEPMTTHHPVIGGYEELAVSVSETGELRLVVRDSEPAAEGRQAME